MKVGGDVTVADEFLTERELQCPKQGADEFVEWLEGLLDLAPSLDGSEISPRDFTDDETTFFYRGQANGAYGLNSSLYRIVRKGFDSEARPAQVEQAMAQSEKRVLERARAEGIGRNLTDLELLTVLQHHLAPTRLLDVSASWKVGLYFATERYDSVDARLFVFALRPGLWREYPRDPSPGLSWPDSAERPWQRTTWPVLLPFTDPRMISQQGFYLTGGLATNHGGNHQYWRDTNRHPASGPSPRAALTQGELREVSTLMIKFPVLRGPDRRYLDQLKAGLRGKWTATGMSIRVPGQMKPRIRTLLAEKYGLTEDSIYPPIDESLRVLRHVAGGD